MSRLLIKNGVLVKPQGESKADLLIENGVICKIAPSIEEKCKVIDATGKHIFY